LACQTLKSGLAKKKVAKFLDNPYENEKEVKFKDWASYGGLASLLITPIQRLPRYNLLLDELVKKTPHEHPDYGKLLESLAAMRQATEAVNESKRTAEDQTALLRIDGELHGKCKDLVLAHRRFIFQDDVKFYDIPLPDPKTGENGKEKEKVAKIKENVGVLYLFSDVAVIAYRGKSLVGKEKLNFKFKIPLSRSEITDSKKVYSSGAKHPIRQVVDQTGLNPNVMFYIQVFAPGKLNDEEIDKMRDSISQISEDEGPLTQSIVVVTESTDLCNKWLTKFNQEKGVVIQKDKDRYEKIKKSRGKRQCCVIL